jgi:hypothetical protein
VLRTLIAERTPGAAPPESELETIFYALIDGSDLPPPLRQAHLAGRGREVRVDLFWEQAGLIVEVDGWDTHGTREGFQRDRERDRLMLIDGRGTMRFTWDDVTKRPQQVIEEIRRALRRRTLRQNLRFPGLLTESSAAGPG